MAVIVLLQHQGGGYIKPTADYIVNFNNNGGSNVPSQTVSTGSKVSKPSDPTKAGYIFKGWQLSGRDYNFNSIVNSNITRSEERRVGKECM